MHRLTASSWCLMLLVCTPAASQDAATLPANPANSVSVDSPSAGSLGLSGIFKNHMVFQRECDAVVWGTASPGATVSVAPSWSTELSRATADANGDWRTTIKTPKAGGPFEVDVKCGGEALRLTDVLVGEVWICSGQSNMQWKLRGFGVDHFKEDVQKARYPEIRFCDVPQVIALRGQDDVDASWTVCTPQTALAFSAVAYFFGSRLHQELDVPIGLISTNWGGSSAEAWVSPEVLKKDFPDFNAQYARNAKISKQTGLLFTRGKKPPKGLNQRNPSVLYNSMIRPLIPFAFRGVIWYQGESNVKNPMQYRTLFPALIRDWRGRWGQGDFPFYFVQIAPFAYKSEPLSAAFLREAQEMALSEKNTGMVVTMDIGNPTNIHPKQKKPVGERLAMLALKHDYGQSDRIASGPRYASHTVESQAIRLRFTQIGSGLISRDEHPLTHFTIAGADKKFVKAKAVVERDTILVSSDKVKAPVAVRFAWDSGDTPNLCNRDGLPASSFRTDDWPIQ